MKTKQKICKCCQDEFLATTEKQEVCSFSCYLEIKFINSKAKTNELHRLFTLLFTSKQTI